MKSLVIFIGTTKYVEQTSADFFLQTSSYDAKRKAGRYKAALNQTTDLLRWKIEWTNTLDLTYLRPLTLNKYIEAEHKNRYLGAKPNALQRIHAACPLPPMVDGVTFVCSKAKVWLAISLHRRIDPTTDVYTKFIFDGMLTGCLHGQAFLKTTTLKIRRGLIILILISWTGRLEIYEMEANTWNMTWELTQKTQ